MTDDTREHLHKLLVKFDDAMLITRTADGSMHARPCSAATSTAG